MSGNQQILLGLAAAAAGGASTWNSADKSASITLSGGNLTATCGAFAVHCVRGTTSKASGKHYFEITIVSRNSAGGGTDQMKLGIATSAHGLTTLLGDGDSVSAGYTTNHNGGGAEGRLVANTEAVDLPATLLSDTDVVGVAVDVSNHLVWFHRNGTYQNSGNPATGVNGIDYVATGAVFPCFQGRATSDQVTLNVGSTAFAHSVPSGFTAWG
jgi:hypothetical protein